MGVWELAPRRIFKDHALWNVENAFLVHRVKVAITNDLSAKKENLSINLEMKDERASLNR